MTKEISAKEQEEALSIYNCKTKTKQTGIVEGENKQYKCYKPNSIKMILQKNQKGEFYRRKQQ